MKINKLIIYDKPEKILMSRRIVLWSEAGCQGAVLHTPPQRGTPLKRDFKHSVDQGSGASC